MRDNDDVGEKTVELKGKGRREKVQEEKKVKEGGRKVKWDYVVLRKKPGGKAARWDYTIEMKGKRKTKAGGKTRKDETKKVDKVWDYSMEINSKE